MNKILSFLVGIILLFCCCNGTKSQDHAIKEFTLPAGATPIVYRQHIYIQGEVDGMPGNLVFDTGAENFYLDTAYYASNNFGYVHHFKGKISGAGTGMQNVIILTDTLNFKFGNYMYRPSMVPVISLKPILGNFADGIIGQEYFSNSVLRINYYHEYIILYDDIQAVDISGYTKIKMKKQNNRLLVPAFIQINESLNIKGDLLLDIGSGGSVTFTSETAQKNKLSEHITHKTLYYTEYGGIGGQSSSFDFRAKSVEIGNYKIDNAVMDYSEDKSGALSSNKYIGLLGNEILERFDVLIDFVNNDLYLKPNENYDKPSEFSRLGFGYVDRDITQNAWIVTGFYKNSPAENAGLKMDDKIITVNGIDIKKIPYEQQRDFWKKQEKAELIVIRNNEKKRVEFELKYIQ